VLEEKKKSGQKRKQTTEGATNQTKGVTQWSSRKKTTSDSKREKEQPQQFTSSLASRQQNERAAPDSRKDSETKGKKEAKAKTGSGEDAESSEESDRHKKRRQAIRHRRLSTMSSASSANGNMNGESELQSLAKKKTNKKQEAADDADSEDKWAFPESNKAATMVDSQMATQMPGPTEPSQTRESSTISNTKRNGNTKGRAPSSRVDSPLPSSDSLSLIPDGNQSQPVHADLREETQSIPVLGAQDSQDLLGGSQGYELLRNAIQILSLLPLPN
jgi:hypothetical protein